MKIRHRYLLILISIFFLSCTSMVKNQITPLSSIDIDFPITEKLEFEYFNKYDIFRGGFCVVDDSVLWSFKQGGGDFGSCYNLHTGEKLSIIASKGRAAYELIQLDEFNIIGDSVQLCIGQNTIKTFAKRDIIENVPLGDRKFSVTIVPDSIWVRRMTKLSNGSVLATILPAFSEEEKANLSEFNRKSVAILNNMEADSYETINYESFDIEKAEKMELPANDLIKCAYADGYIEIRDDDMAVFSVNNQFILYTFDIKRRKVVSEKKYTNVQRIGGQGSLGTKNDRKLNINVMKTNNQNILCIVSGYLSEKDKNSKLFKKAIFVFDWNLNPIKKFDLPEKENGYYILSNDGSAVYFCDFTEDNLTLHKADLNI